MKLILIAVVAATGFTFVRCHPAEDSNEREKRASSSASASASSSSSGGISSSNSFSTASGNDNYGIGSPNGGLDLTAGLSIPSPDTRTKPLFPWGAFAGINLPDAGRIGGCSGFGCGFQFGDFSAPFPSFGNNGGFSSNDPGLFGRSGFPNQYQYNTNYPNNFNSYNYPQFPNMGFNYNYPMFRDFQFAPNPTYQFQQRAQFPNINTNANANNDLAGFARFGSSSSSSNNNGGRGTFTSSSFSNNNGVVSGTGTVQEPNGRVTTFQRGPGGPDTIQTRILPAGSSKGVFSASGVSQGPDGNVSIYRAGGQI